MTEKRGGGAGCLGCRCDHRLPAAALHLEFRPCHSAAGAKDLGARLQPHAIHSPCGTGPGKLLDIDCLAAAVKGRKRPQVQGFAGVFVFLDTHLSPSSGHEPSYNGTRC